MSGMRASSQSKLPNPKEFESGWSPGFLNAHPPGSCSFTQVDKVSCRIIRGYIGTYKVLYGCVEVYDIGLLHTIYGGFSPYVGSK